MSKNWSKSNKHKLIYNVLLDPYGRLFTHYKCTCTVLKSKNIINYLYINFFLEVWGSFSNTTLTNFKKKKKWME